MGFGVEVLSALVLVLFLPLCVAELVDISPYHSAIVDRHNEIRREVGASDMMAMEWDKELADQADAWTRYCRYDRAPKRMYDCGQNLHYSRRFVMGWPEIDRSIRRAMRRWYKESSAYTYGKDCGRSCSYVQMIWSTATAVGCGMSRCPVMKVGTKYLRNKTLFACFYAPKSQLMNDFPYTPGLPCSSCPLGWGCEGDLCVPQVNAVIPVAQPSRYEIGPEIAPKTPEIDNVPERIPVPRQPRPPVVAPPPQCIPLLDTTEVSNILAATNEMRMRENLMDVAWSEELERWAQYVIRCNIEYPGPRTAYTNFGKCDAGGSLAQLVRQWGMEGIDTSIPHYNGGCRTPGDVATCNHNTNLMAAANRRMGCAACLCGLERQLTCIYDAK